MKKIILILLFVNYAYSQGLEEWIRYYDGSSHSSDMCNAMALDNSGNIYVTGYTTNNGTDEDYTTIKYNTHGDTIWVRKFTLSSYDEATAIAVDNIGNVYVSGTCEPYIITIKYNPTGDLLWVNKFYELNAYFSVSGIKIDNSGNVYILGSSLFEGFLTFKYNSSGNTQWTKRYYNQFGGEATGIALDNSGNIVICGYLYINNNDDFVTIKYNSLGDTLWVRRYNSGSYDHPSAVAIDNSGNVYVTGEGFGSPFSWWAYVYTTVKYDLNGNLQWVKTYDGLGPDRDYATDVKVDAIGNIYITGYSSAQASGFDFATIKYNSNGDSLWVRRYNGPANSDDYANSMILDNSGNVYVTGISKGFNGHYDCATVKYNTMGDLQWVQRFHSPSDSDSYSNVVKVDSSGNIYIAGGCFFKATGNDFMTIKYSNIIGIKQISNEVPNKFSLSQNYPNPFNPTTKIKFEIPKPDFVRLVIYNEQGREVEILVNEKLQSGTYESDWKADRYTSGVYFYKLESGNFVQTKKMILIK